MASAFSHAFVAIALGKASRRRVMTWRVLLLGVGCSILPDVDVIGLRYGIQYGDLWGHRGLTHSLFFAGIVSTVMVNLGYRREPTETKVSLCSYFLLCTASHGALDALTDGGLGVAFFSPFDTTRYFFPIRPVAVSPIGIGDFFNEYGIRVLASEAVWIWLPTCVTFIILRALYRVWLAQPAAERSRTE